MDFHPLWYKRLIKSGAAKRKTVISYPYPPPPPQMALKDSVLGVTAAIKHTKKGFALGPDGFMLTDHNTLIDKLVPHFLTAFNTILKGAAIHLNALTSPYCTHSQGREGPPALFYYPISQINIDIKLFTKILTKQDSYKAEKLGITVT